MVAFEPTAWAKASPPPRRSGTSAARPLTIEAAGAANAAVRSKRPAHLWLIEAGKSITITVNFTPTEVGDFNGEISLKTSAGQADGRPFRERRPAGGAPARSEPNEFGAGAVGSDATRTFTVANTGGTAVMVNKSKPPSGGEFSATTSLAEGTTIAPGETLTEEVVFAPTAPGPAEGVWLINGAGTSGLREVRFSGVGTTEPNVETTDASSVGKTGATLNATVDPNGEAVSNCHFDYGTTLSYGSSVPCEKIPAPGDAAVPVSSAIGALSPGTTYYFRIVATNGTGTSYGAAESLTTEPAAPTVETVAPSSVGQTTATLNGTVKPNGGALSDCDFEYGPTIAYGSSVSCATLPPAGSGPVAVSAPVAGLTTATAYDYRIVATNSAGTTDGTTQTLTTLPATSFMTQILEAHPCPVSRLSRSQQRRWSLMPSSPAPHSAQTRRACSTRRSPAPPA